MNRFSHEELSLMLFALEGAPAVEDAGADPACEDACPVVGHIEEMFAASALSPEKHLARHLNNHLREALIESGMLELMARFTPGAAPDFTAEDQAKLHRASEKLKQWSCQIRLDEPDTKMLSEAVRRLPRSAWVTMPRTLWRLRKKLKSR